jgi:ABC-type transporter Mla MlaB component
VAEINSNPQSATGLPPMVSTSSKTGGVRRLVLKGELTIRTIESVHAKLLDLIAQRTRIELDVTGATQVDISFIQLALAARRSAEAAGKTVVWAAPAGGALREALMRGGFVNSVPGHESTAEIWWLTTARAP